MSRHHMHNQIIHPFLRSYETRLSDHDVKRGCDHNPPPHEMQRSFIHLCMQPWLWSRGKGRLQSHGLFDLPDMKGRQIPTPP
eukprot:6180376-Pleurochrysis_carterae.AAC.3